MLAVLHSKQKPRIEYNAANVLACIFGGLFTLCLVVIVAHYLLNLI